MYLSNNLYYFKYNNYNIKLLSVRHDQRNINFNDMKKLIDESNQRKVCFLLETDYNKNQIQIRKKFGDFTSQQFMNLLLKEEKQNNLKKCVNGWDVRQSLIKQQYQDYLYTNGFYKLPFEIIEKYYLTKINFKKINNKNINNNIKLFLEHNYKQVINHHKYLIDNELNVIKNVIKNEQNYKKLSIENIVSKYNKLKNNFINIVVLLRQLYAIYSDLFILEKILRTNIKNDYIIILGEFHFNDLINFIKHMQKDNLL